MSSLKLSLELLHADFHHLNLTLNPPLLSPLTFQGYLERTWTRVLHS